MEGYNIAKSDRRVFMLQFTDVIIKSADLGGESLIPDIHDASSNPYFSCDESVCDDWKVNVGKGMIKTRLPYKDQNMYTNVFFKAVIKRVSPKIS